MKGSAVIHMALYVAGLRVLADVFAICVVNRQSSRKLLKWLRDKEWFAFSLMTISVLCSSFRAQANGLISFVPFRVLILGCPESINYSYAVRSWKKWTKISIKITLLMLEIGKKIWKSGETGSSDVSTKGQNKNPSSEFFQILQKSGSKYYDLNQSSASCTIA